MRWYSASTLAEESSAKTELSDGWGVMDGLAAGELIVSDGSSTLSTVDARSLRTLSRLPVTDGGRPVARLNELEMVDGEVWANVWLTDCIARIDPATGHVRGWVQLGGIRGADAHGDVLNGIAWDAPGKRLLVTVCGAGPSALRAPLSRPPQGKYWKQLFHIEVVEDAAASLADARRRCIPQNP